MSSFPIPSTPAPDWDADPANIIAPVDGLKNTGWLPFVIPTAQVFNWFWTGISEWTRHFQANVASYTLPQTAFNDGDISQGDTFKLYEDDSAQPPGVQAASGGVAGATAVCVTGSHVIATTTASIEVLDRDTLVLIRSIPLTGAGVVRRVVCDGITLAVAKGTTVEAFDISDVNVNIWSQLWLFDHTADVHDICLDAVHVYLVGVVAAGFESRALGIAGGGAPVWNYAHGATLFSCCTDGLYLNVGGSAGTGAFTIRGLDAFTGSDLAADGAWSASNASAFTVGHQMACDREALYILDGGNLVVRSKGTSDGGVSITGATLTHIACDGELVFGCAGNYIVAYSGKNHSALWRRPLNVGGIGNPAEGIATDGAAVFVTRPASSDCIRVVRGNRPGWWLKTGTPPPYSAPRQRIAFF